MPVARPSTILPPNPAGSGDAMTMTQMTTSLPLASDPLPPGRIAMWLLVASDAMFFLGLVGAFVVLRTANAALFADHAHALDKRMAAAGVLFLLLSSAAMWLAVRAARKGLTIPCCIALLATLLCATAFIGTRGLEYVDLLNHHTIVARQNASAPLWVYEGQADWWNGDPIRVINGYAAPLPTDFDPHAISEGAVAKLANAPAQPKEFSIPAETFEDIRYGPAKNIFYAIWYTITAAHLLHIAVAALAIKIISIQFWRKKASARHVEYVGFCWHFIVFIGLFLFPLLYLI